MMRWLWVALLGTFLFLSIRAALDGIWVMAAVYLLIGLVASWRLSPWKGGRTIRHQEVLAMAEEDRRVVIYWRPGCGYCARLRSTLGQAADRATWVNIWQDEDAAAFVRSVNDGNEVVPTVVIDGVALTNPPPAVVKERIETLA